MNSVIKTKSIKEMTGLEIEKYCEENVHKYAALLHKWEEKLKIQRLMNHTDKEDE